MEKESNISLGGTKILLALFVQRYMFGQRFRVTLKVVPDKMSLVGENDSKSLNYIYAIMKVERISKLQTCN